MADQITTERLDQIERGLHAEAGPKESLTAVTARRLGAMSVNDALALCSLAREALAARTSKGAVTEEARPIIEAAFSGALTLSIGSCTCGVKSQNIEFHDVGCHYRIATKLLDDLSALRAAARVAPEPVAANRLLRDETTEWQTDRADGTVTVHSRMIDGVLCRWWGDGAPPAGVAKIDAALYASPGSSAGADRP